ncbi:MAG: hypothetical protein SFY81_01060 [Verrucomicrobiota bacterium]|nr:hypothetical protein [Verrucomicrobiota bacterium]
MIHFRIILAMIVFGTAPYSWSGSPWRWSNPLPHGNHVYDMISWQGKVIQVGDRGTIYSSLNLDHWRSENSPTTNSLRALTVFQGGIVISGARGTIVQGQFLTNLQSIQLPTSDWLEGIAASSNAVVAVGDNGSVYWSSNSVNFELVTALPEWLRGIAYGNGRFVAVGENGLIAASAEGRNWDEENSGTSEHLNRIAFLNGEFWIAGDNGVVVQSNPTGGWTAAQSGVTNHLFTVAGNSNSVIVAGDGALLSKSIPGTTWESQGSLTNFPSPAWTYYSSLWEGRLYLVGGRSGLVIEGFRTNSASPFTWVSRSDSPRDWFWSTVYQNDQYTAVGANGLIMASENGVDWIQAAVPPAAETNILLGVNGTTNLLIAVGTDGLIFHSTNRTTNVLVTNMVNGQTQISTNQVSLYGLLWEESPRATTGNLQGIGLLGNLFIVSGDSGIILTSDDGQNWIPRSSGLSNPLSSVVVYPGGVLASGDLGALTHSLDGINWQPRSSPVTNWIYQIRYLKNQLIGVGEDGLIITSTNGTEWVRQSSGTARWLNDVVYAASNYWIAGDGGILLKSMDGVNWTHIVPNTSKSLYSLASDGKQLIAIGPEGTVLRHQAEPHRLPVNLLNYSMARGQEMFLLTGLPDQLFCIEATDDLQTWEEVSCGELDDPSGTLLFPQPASNHPFRFYRTRLKF